MSSGSKTKTVNKSEQGPWKPSVPYLTGIMSEAQNTYNKGLNNTYQPFSTTVPFSNQTEDGLGMWEDRARNGSPLLDTANQHVQGMMTGSWDQSPAAQYQTATARGDHLNGNPWLDKMYNHASGKIANSVNANVGLRGRTGSGAHQQMLQDGLGDLATSLYGDNYNQERTRQNQAVSNMQSAWNTNNARRDAGVGMAQGLANSAYIDAEALRGVGEVRENQARTEVDDLMARHTFSQVNPWEQISLYNQLMSGMGGQGNTGKSTNIVTEKPSAISALGSLVGVLATPYSTGTGLSTSLLGKVFGG